MWEPFDTGGTIGQEGSENGTIIRDEEHLRVRASLLSAPTPTAQFAITCGVYGWMVHTRFFSIKADAFAQFEAIKGALPEIIATIPATDDPDADAKIQGISEALKLFIQRYP